MYSILFRLTGFFCFAALFACSPTIPVREFSNTADPSMELAAVDSEISKALESQVDVLAPKSFMRATTSMDKAREIRGEDGDQKDILHEIAVAKAYLQKAKEIANVSSQILPGVVRERGKAVIAKAPKYFMKEFAAVDKDLKDVTEEIEANNTSSAVNIRQSLESRYSDLELKSIIQAKLGGAKSTLQQAIGEGAKNITPQTWAWAEKQIRDAEAVITNSRHDVIEVERASQSAKEASLRLLRMVRQAKSSSVQSPEQLASQIELRQEAEAFAADESAEELRQTEKKLDETKSELDTEKERLTALSVETEKLESETRLEKDYDWAQRLFSKDEAEVYKKGNRLLLRLKGLSFGIGQSVITAKNYPLLTKVQKVIKNSDPENIIIEGHTDSTGSKSLNKKISMERAKAVESYLEANNFIESNKVVGLGLGDSKPVASNTTQRGRAQNRRVDIILVSKRPK